MRWRPMKTAPKDGRPILVRFRRFKNSDPWMGVSVTGKESVTKVLPVTEKTL
jgi:hypothetical protein